MKKYEIKDILIGISIIILPIFLFIHKWIPEADSLIIFNFTFDRGEFTKVNVLVWILCFKFFTIAILSLWYISCKHWWKQAILVPLIIELFKFFGVFYTQHDFIDEIDFLYSLPLTLPIIIAVIIISKRLNYYSITQDLKDDMDEEINTIFSELAFEGHEKIKQVIIDFEHAKLNSKNLNNKEYLKELKSLKNRLKNF
ncbi:hypothetical protein A9Q87_09330 [Flavobacteriales bacterium 34_180_T64]|nr:hypothetical protein A9Q87_09330 [Flavobacteriales bacterium 34_180_T64]